ncbi:MAG: Uma2 family endonuclease [Gemmataceae bacterium]
MTTAVADAPKVYTEADLLAMPDDGVERWLIRGQLREKPSEYPGVKMTVRNRHHCNVMSFITATLTNWSRTQPKPRGQVYCGEAGVRLHGSEGTTVGVDVVYAPPEVVAVQSDDETTMIDGVPTLAVEILSPNDTVEQIDEKVDEYLTAGVPLVWIVHTHRQTVTVYRPDQPAALFNITQRLIEHPAMPGFAPAVAELFE